MNDNFALIVCQLLLVRAGSRIKLKRVAQAGYNSYLFKAHGRRSGKRVVMPIIGTRTDSMPILSVLDETGQLEWMCNGQVLAGGKQLAHYGDCGRVVLLHPKSHLQEVFGETAQTDEKLQKRIDYAPEELSLSLRDEFDQETRLVLPTAEEAEWLVRALGNTPVSISPGLEERFRTLIDSFGLALTLIPASNPGKQMVSKDWVKVNAAA